MDAHLERAQTQSFPGCHCLVAFALDQLLDQPLFPYPEATQGDVEPLEYFPGSSRVFLGVKIRRERLS